MFSGKIDDFRIYNNVLNAEEIQAAMNNWISERIEAENMSLSNYTVETNSIASGGKHVKVNTNTTGTAQFTFTEPSGVYDLSTAYYAQLRNPVMNIAKVEFYAADSNTGSIYVDDVKVN